jgi:sugar-specific transcriptional regulator TrmB
MSNLTIMVDRLTRLGLSPDEARTYLSLVRAGAALDPAQVVASSGLAPQSVDAALARLIARGAAFRTAAPGGLPAAYSALTPEALLARLRCDFESSLTDLRAELPRLTVGRPTYSTLDLDNRPAVLERAAVLIRAARRGIWAAIWPAELRQFDGLLDEARRAEVDVTVLLGGERADLSGASFWHRRTDHDSVLAHLGYRLLVLTADNNQSVIAGFHDEQPEQTWGVVTDNPALVLLAVEYVRNNIGAPTPDQPGVNATNTPEQFRSSPR